MHGGYAVLGQASTDLAARGGLASRYLASHRPGAGGGGAGALTRTTSGILFFDDFVRSDRALNGDNGWVDDAGTWSIVSNVATSSGGNFDRCRNTGMTPVATAIYEARAQSPSGGIYNMLRFLAPSASDDYHLDMKGDNTDKRLSRAAASDVTLASITMTMDTSYHVHKVWYSGTRDIRTLVDHTYKLGNAGTPFTPSTGPTAAGAVGLMGYGGAPLFDWVLVSSDRFITVTGLSGTQGFRLINSSSTVLGSSGTQSSGSATLDILTLVDGLTNGHIQVYEDAGTWAVPTTNGRYPAVSGDATDIAGGDIYHLS